MLKGQNNIDKHLHDMDTTFKLIKHESSTQPKYSLECCQFVMFVSGLA